MLCIPKKDGTLRMIFDLRQWNDNTVKDVMPFPDQDHIHTDVAKHRYRSKIDMSNAFEQLHIEPLDIWKTAFASVFRTYVSNVMMMGDCNAPATFQRLMTLIFRDIIGRYVHVYMDDIFVYSKTIEEHEQHLREVFTHLRQPKFYLKSEKCELYTEKMDCLGHTIDSLGIHTASDKMERICE